MIATPDEQPPFVAIRDLRKAFGDRTVLDGVSFDVPRGQVVVIMGPSGSGKTTLLRSINALEQPESGTISLAGVHIDFASTKSHRDLRALRLKTAMVFQAFNLFPHRTVLDNVVEGPVFVRGQDRASARAHGRALLTRMGLGDRCDAYPGQLSGGQKQRVAIARGLAMEPALMLFDEPTSALDSELRGDVLTVIRELAASGMTMVIVTHEREFARDVADRVLLFRDGRIREDAPPTAIL